MKIIFHGAAKEVGKSCIEIISQGQRYILDSGIKFIAGGVEYPKFLDKIYELDAIFISHSHLDHVGALPLLEHKRLDCPIYMTPLTWQISKIMLEDSYNLAILKHLHPAYIERDIRRVKKDLKKVKYDQLYTTPDGKVKFTYLNAGHIPGSASVLLELEGKKILYTGDLNTENTTLMVPSDLNTLSNEIDILITENTYGDRPHPDKKDVKEGIIKSVNSCIKNGGSCLIPVFSIGRSQEILMILKDLDPEIPVYLDGMARKITDLVLRSDDKYIDNKDILEEMSKRVKYVNPRQRHDLAKKKGIVIVTTSGMVQGGPVMTYCQHMIHDPDNFIILTGYQAKGTNGRFLFEDHLFYSHHQRSHVKAHVRKFDFSAHYGQASIRKLIEKINFKNLILQHGDLEALEESQRYAKTLKKGNVFIPSIGEELEF